MTDFTEHDEAIAREAWASVKPNVIPLVDPILDGLIVAARRGRERAPQPRSSPEHDEALIVEARRRHGYSVAPGFDAGLYHELLAMARSGWTPEPDPDEVAVRAILGAWQGNLTTKTTGHRDFQAALAAYRQAKRGEG